jgi:hypothetical protein
MYTKEKLVHQLNVNFITSNYLKLYPTGFMYINRKKIMDYYSLYACMQGPRLIRPFHRDLQDLVYFPFLFIPLSILRF